MLSIAAAVWLGLLVAGGATTYATAERLPPRVASHFNCEGFADSYILRDDYLVMILLLVVALPAAIAVLGMLLPHIAPRMLRITSRDYWLAPERRDVTYASLSASGLVVASMVTAFMIVVHLFVIEAKQPRAARLDSAAMWIAITALVAGALAWQLLRWRQFRLPR